jgi:2-polyprenyl-6-methoxyphenol hydroxylase-like FAD-dependent oxidoreductase
MRTVVVGAGPTGLFTAIALARRGREVVVVDRDPGPAGDGTWRRRGVMQFEHAHTFRGPVVDALRAEVPDALSALTEAGAAVITAPDGTAMALRCRRAVFERVLRDIASREPHVTLAVGHVDHVHRHAGRAVGVAVDGSRVECDLVIDASGRASRVMRAARGRHDGEGGPCGAAYVSRQYRLREAAHPAAVNSPVGLSLGFDGYFAVVFLHDDRTFSVTITHGGTDSRLHGLRNTTVYEAALHSIPRLADWIEPDRARPLTPVLPGGRLYNSYRSQLGEDGRPLVPGLIAVGDSVCTTTPLAGRGVSLAFLQVRALLRCLATHAGDDLSAATEFDHWCRAHVRPWFVDHMRCDDDRLRRWAGGDIDLTRPLPSDLVVAAAGADTTLRAAVEPYDRMLALPASLDVVQERAAAVYACGWRPPVAAGPSREELAALCQELGTARDMAGAGQCTTGQPCPV